MKKSLLCRDFFYAKNLKEFSGSVHMDKSLRAVASEFHAAEFLHHAVTIILPVFWLLAYMAESGFSFCFCCRGDVYPVCRVEQLALYAGHYFKEI